MLAHLATLPSAAQLADLCRRYHITELALFGSVARAESHPSSDLDLYVEFTPGHHPGLHWFDLEEELTALFGRPVDLSRKSLLKPAVLREATRDAIVLYTA